MSAEFLGDMGESLKWGMSFGLAGVVSGLSWIWVRESGRYELGRLRKAGVWRRKGDEGGAFLQSVLLTFGAAVVMAVVGLGPWSLGVVLPFPLLLRLVLLRRHLLHQRVMENSCLLSFYALKGFLESGLNLSSSLFLLGSRFPLEFPRRLARTLARFDEGASLESCLGLVMKRNRSPEVGEVVAALLAGYANGLPLLPFVEHGIGVLERHRRCEARVGRVQSVAVAQGVFAFLLPWAILLYLCHTQGWALADLLKEPGFLLFAAMAVGLEAAGFWTLWVLARPKTERALLQFIESVHLHLKAGFDLSFAWEESARNTGRLAPKLAAELAPPMTSLAQRLERLGTDFRLIEVRVWFFLLLGLYQEGSPVVAALRSFRDRLVKEQEEQLLRHGEEYPLKASVILLLFFLPATFFLIGYPLLSQWLKVLN